MNQIRLQRAKSIYDAEKISKLAFLIWREHYIPIIGKDNVEYMLELFQKPEHIFDAMQNGMEYYSIWLENTMAGYTAIKQDTDQKRLFLSKLYIQKSYRNRGLARFVLERFEQIALNNQYTSIWLFVNQENNSSREFYKKMGFYEEDVFKNNMGNGIIMDDVIMVKKILS
jgi:ribosomal protein S18 acetylase RimI-like enzyme